MENLKFSTDINPFGILFNPLSICNCIQRLISGEEFSAAELFHHGGLWHSYQHHGRFSSVSQETTLQNINTRITSGASYIREADFLVLTLGTAWVYELKETGRIVANCHKVPSSAFKRYRLSVGETVDGLRGTLEQLWKVNPAIKTIITVSPVRHMKDGAVENQVSKATLLLAADALVRGFGEERCSYFPAYELMMDELRDYRFYAEDMVHPSPVAAELIWEKFRDWLADKESRDLSQQISSLMLAFHHRPLNPEIPEYQLFLSNSLQKALELSKRHPFLDFSAEIEYFSNKKPIT